MHGSTVLGLSTLVLTLGCGKTQRPDEAHLETGQPAPSQGQLPEPTGAASPTTSSSEVLSQTLGACKTQDEALLWQLMATPFRGQLSSLTSRMASALSPAEFAEAHGYSEPIETLDEEAFLRVVLRTDNEHENMCWKAAAWKELARDESQSQLAVLYELPNGHGRGVLIESSEAGWKLAKITKSLKPEQYATVVPSYQP